MPETTPEKLLEEWSGGKDIKPVYYLSGEEKFLKEEAVKKLLGTLKPDTFNFSAHTAGKSAVRDIVYEAMTPPVIADVRVIIVRSAGKFSQSDEAALAEYFKDPSPATCLVLLSDKKKEPGDTLAKILPPGTVSAAFNPLNVFQAQKFLRDTLAKCGRNITLPAAELMIDIIGTDTLAIKHEAEKLSVYRADKTGEINEEDVIESAGFSKTHNPFELSKAVYNRQKEKAVELTEKLLSEGVEPLRILYNISSTLEKLLKVKKISAAGSSADNAYYSLGISRGYYLNILESSKLYTEEKLLKSIRRCLETESMLKSSSGITPQTLVKRLLYELLGAK